MEALTDALAVRLDCRVRTSRRIGRVIDSGRGVFFLSASFWRVSTTPLSPANWTSQAWSYTTSIRSWSTSVKRSVAWRNSPLHELLCVSQKVACLTCAVDLRLETPSDRQSVVVANAFAARLFHIVRSQWHGGAWSWSSTSTFFNRLYVCREAVLLWLGSMFRLAWRQREQRAHEEHVCVVLFCERFWRTWDQPNKTEQDTSSSVTCRCFLEARAHDAWHKIDELFQISAT